MKTSSSSPIHVLIACGGTGGHLFPGIAVGEVLAQRGHDVTLLISEKKIDSLAASGHKDLRFEKMPFLAMPRPWSPKMVGFLRGLWGGMRRCRQIIREHDVKVVLGMGGFTSFAPLYAGKKENCRTLIHESNAIPGKANKLNARYSDIVLCGLEACKPLFEKHTDVRVVGTPIRSNMREANSDDPHAFFKLEKDKRTLLIMGGSQGARGINRAVGMALDHFEKMGIQVLHIAGPGDYEEVRDVYAKHPLLAQHVAAFCHRMDLAYRVADLAIARSGASSMTELAWFGVPSLLVPYPHAAEDHQTRNAEIFHKAGAAIMMPESQLNADTLTDVVRSILSDSAKAAAMKKAAQNQAVRDSAEQIATLVEQEAVKTPVAV
ncbi:MAG: undecaprenyldiphospho-muramoylpentapeptide beta-N-acetylglucosaminyltransferase [Verrucomicrobiaceae bacterium]|nr:undecaprenyldiphospho-muramoylpentapeptide beta-N-acetylglucosaminyltransferase [Verrucomicrobiaceae bacterium]